MEPKEDACCDPNEDPDTTEYKEIGCYHEDPDNPLLPILLHPVDVPHKLQQPAVKIFPYTLAKQHLSWLALGGYFGAHFILGLTFGYLGLDHAAVGNFKTQHPLSGS